MARPFKQGLSYFPHDTDAVNDDKIQALMALYGTDGYTFYFVLLEKVFHTENGRITIGSDAIMAGYAKTIGIKLNRFKTILGTALEVGCFDKDIYDKEKVLTSNGIEKRVISVNTLRLKERERKEKDKDKYKRKGKAKTGKPTENSTNPLNMQVQDLENIQNNDNFGKTKPLFILPSWIKKESWEGFVEMRKKIKKPLTENAMCLSIAKLERFKNKGQDVNEILDNSTMGCWQGLFELKKGNNEKPKKWSNLNSALIEKLQTEGKL